MKARQWRGERKGKGTVQENLSLSTRGTMRLSAFPHGLFKVSLTCWSLSRRYAAGPVDPRSTRPGVTSQIGLYGKRAKGVVM